VLAAISLLNGLATEELRWNELEQHDPEYEVLLTAKAVKPGAFIKKTVETSTLHRGVQRLDRYSEPRALILLYHRIAQLPSDPWSMSVTPEHFAQHLEILRTCACPIPLQHLIQASSNKDLPERPVVLTFDDGYVDNLQQAKPLLERYEVPASFFLAAGYLGREGEFWWDELERLLLQPGSLPETLHLDIAGNAYRWELGTAATYSDDDSKPNCAWRAWEEPPSSRHQIYRLLWELMHPLSEVERRNVLEALRIWAREQPAGRPTHRLLSLNEVCALVSGELIEIGAHSMTHPALSALPVSAQWDEIQQSKVCLETILKRPVRSFAYPFGRQCDYLPETVAVVRDVGFTCACGNFTGVVDRFTDRFQLPRISVGDWERKDFVRHLDKWFTF
jgi:peptidoglycan/xylan/chitin deacetylase (PgdA/CDA1 family)